jgi:hypothetical protein
MESVVSISPIIIPTEESYIDKINVKKLMYLVQQLEYRIVQLQVDIQTGNLNELSYFRKEADNIKLEIVSIKNSGANDEELKRLYRLYEGVEIEMIDIKYRLEF